MTSTTMRPARFWEHLTVQLALAFVAVTLAGITAAIVISALTVISDAKQVVVGQQIRAAKAAAAEVAVSYRRSGWAASGLAPQIDAIRRAGPEIQVRDLAGQVVGASPGYARSRAPKITVPVRLDEGRRVGSVTLKYGERTVGKLLGPFEARRWRARLLAGGAGVAVAVFAALLLAPLIAGPVDRMAETARRRGRGQPHARVGAIRGPRELRDLAASFDQMAEYLSREDEMRRNMVAHFAHELRTPVSVLQGSTEAILDGVMPLTTASVDSLHEEAVSLSHMVAELQRLAAAESAALQLRLAPCDLASVAGAVADSLAGIFLNARIRLVRELTSVQVRCDRARFRDVISNLLTNAAKFTPAGGQVTLRTQAAGDMAILQVTDTGIGISPEELPRLTERFYRGRESAEITGSGIGLAIVDELVRAHRGSMEITSQPGIGTQVTIQIPQLPAGDRAPTDFR